MLTSKARQHVVVIRDERVFAGLHVHVRMVVPSEGSTQRHCGFAASACHTRCELPRNFRLIAFFMIVRRVLSLCTGQPGLAALHELGSVTQTQETRHASGWLAEEHSKFEFDAVADPA